MNIKLIELYIFNAMYCLSNVHYLHNFKHLLSIISHTLRLIILTIKYIFVLAVYIELIINDFQNNITLNSILYLNNNLPTKFKYINYNNCIILNISLKFQDIMFI